MTATDGARLWAGCSLDPDADVDGLRTRMQFWKGHRHGLDMVMAWARRRTGRVQVSDADHN